MSVKTNCVIEFAKPIESVEELKTLLTNSRFSTFYSRIHRDSQGLPSRWRVNGQLKTWKRDPNRFRLPIKHGLYDYDAIESLDDLNKYLASGYEVCIVE